MVKVKESRDKASLVLVLLLLHFSFKKTKPQERYV